MPTLTPVIHDMDANVDDFMAAVVIEAAKTVTNLTGVLITNADCVGDLAPPIWKKIADFIGNAAPFGLTSARGRNAFPWAYRLYGVQEENIPLLNGTSPLKTSIKGDALYAQLLQDARTDPAVILATGPLTALENVLRRQPVLQEGISQLILDAGAINVPGNLDPKILGPKVANPKGEWNIFWDPDAVDYIFRETPIPITLLPLDVTGITKVTKEFLGKLEEQGKEFPYSELAFQSFNQIVSNLPPDSYPFFLWDMTAAIYAVNPELFEDPKLMHLKIITEGFNQGSVIETHPNDPNGRPVDVVLAFNKTTGIQGFYDFILKILRQ